MVSGMKLFVFPLALVSAMAVAPAASAREAVGLGFGAGVSAASLGDLSLKTAFNWGFYTDIPLLSTFHITPSTMLYNLATPIGVQAATDVSLNFKFMIPIGPLDLFAAATVGVTSRDRIDPHVGGLAGASINIISNIDLFVQLGYKIVIADGGNIKDFQASAGPLFRFYY
jgi:hypothetical protein